MRMPGQVDHLVYAVPDLDRAIEDLEKRLGVRAAPGGRHSGEGTRNALIGLGTDSYLEILAPDPDQPLPSRSLWLGLEGRKTPRLTAWAVKGRHLEALVHRAQESGVRLGHVEAGSRRRPDGSLLQWEFTDPHTVVAEGLVPFFIDWGSSAHPASAAPAGVSLLALRAEHPRPAGVTALLRGLGLQLPVTKGDRAALIAHLETPRGVVELR
jgi:Glyoxalase-like domain